MVKELTEEQNNFLKERAVLKMSNKNLAGEMDYLKYEIKELKKEVNIKIVLR